MSLNRYSEYVDLNGAYSKVLRRNWTCWRVLGARMLGVDVDQCIQGEAPFGGEAEQQAALSIAKNLMPEVEWVIVFVNSRIRIVYVEVDNKWQSITTEKL